MDKKKLETMTFGEIFNLDTEKKQKLQVAICGETLRTSQCLSNWALKRRTPCFAEQKIIQEKIQEVYGVTVHVDVLFPKKPQAQAGSSK